MNILIRAVFANILGPNQLCRAVYSTQCKNFITFYIERRKLWNYIGWKLLKSFRLRLKAVRLLAVYDKKCHPHPPSPYHVYKIFILCEIIGGKLSAGMETSEAGFLGRNELPELSVERNTESQICTMFEYLDNPNKEALFD